MDTSTKIIMRLQDDLYSSDKYSITETYDKYYESLDKNQSRIVVTDAIKRILDCDSNAECQFNETTFTLSTKA